MLVKRIMCIALLAVIPPVQRTIAQVRPPASAAAKAAELAKFDNPDSNRAKSGPGGTDWDGQYRSLFQTDADAVAKGYPKHAQAIAEIEADAALSNANLQQHKGWVLFIMWATKAYRAEEGTAALKALYTGLVDMEFGGKSTVVLPKAVATKFPFEGDTRLTIQRNVVYGKSNAAMQRLDAYLVKATTRTPVLVEFHGGGWRNGGKSQFDAYPGDLIAEVLNAGISVISVDYRLTPGSTLPAMTDDAARAVQFIRSKALEWHIDPNRIIAIGGSAGAHLAAWVALHDDMAQPESRDPVERQSSRLTAFVDLWGPMDLLLPNPSTMATVNVRGEDFSKAFTAACGCSAAEYNTDPAARKRMREASPLFYVTRDDPPAMIVHQGPIITDRNHPEIPAIINDPHSWQQGVLLADAMEDAGLVVVRYISPTAGKDPARDVPMILGFLKAQFNLTP